MSRTLRIAQYWVRTAGIDERVQVLARKYPQVPPDQIREMAAVDPSGPRGSFLEWMVRRTKEGNIRWPEDKNRVGRALGMYAELKKKPREMKRYGVNPDINRYTLHSLEGVYRQIYGQAESHAPEELRGSVKIYDHLGFQVFRIGGPGTDDDAAIKDACEFANGTFWCTADPDTAKIYLERGPLYVIYQDGDKIAQTDGQQIMDPNDEEINFPDNPALFEVLVNIGLISKAQYAYEYAVSVVGGRLDPEDEKEILKDPYYLGQYLDELVHGRWTEAEPVILATGDPGGIYSYARFQLGGQRWPEGEKVLLESDSSDQPPYLAKYAMHVMRKRWPEAEPLIKRNPFAFAGYNNFFNLQLDRLDPGTTDRWP